MKRDVIARLGLLYALALILAFSSPLAAQADRGSADSRSILGPPAATLVGVGGAEDPIAGVAGVADGHAVMNFSAWAGSAPAIGTHAVRKELPPRMPLPAHRPAPLGPALSTEPASPSAQLGPTTFSPATSENFLGLDDNNTSIPPDTNGAVGPNHLMVALNTQVRVQNRSGTVLSTMTLDNFWVPVSATVTFDPKVVYDPYAHRWIMTTCSNPQSEFSSILIAVSRTSDPTGDWDLYRIKGDSQNQVWVDYPSIGFNKDWIVVQVNMYDISDNMFNRVHIYVFDKQNLYAGGTGKYTLISRAGIDAVIAPAVTFDNTLNKVYLLQNYDGSAGGKGTLRLYQIAGAVGSEQLSLIGSIQTSNPWDDFSPGGLDFAPQLGSTHLISANDSRVQNVVYRNGSLWMAHTIFLPSGGVATRSAVQWWQINPSGTVIQRGRIDDPTGVKFYGFPTIAVNKNNEVLIGYSRFSGNTYASAAYRFRAAADPPNTLRDEALLKAGLAPYWKDFGSGENRWGDYSATMVDPVNDTDLWTIQEFAALPSGGWDRWGTWWGHISLVAPVPNPNLIFLPLVRR